jgi:hypothetical protein
MNFNRGMLLFSGMILFMLLFSAFVLPGEASAATYYMSPSGSDSNSGTISSPWKTLQKANSVLRAGDTLYVRGGTYSGSGNVSVSWTASGASGSPVTIRNYSTEKPVFDGNGATWLIISGSTALRDLVFDGLEIMDFLGNAFRLYYGTNITIKNCYIHDLKTYQSGAIYFGGKSDGSVSNVIVEKCRLERIGANGTRGTYTNGDHMIYIASYTSNITIRNNFFKDCYSGAAVHMYHSPAAKTVKIYNNIFVLKNGLYRCALRQESATGVEFYNNTVITEGSTNTYGIRVGSGSLVVKNNIFQGSTSNGYIYRTGGTFTADYNIYWPYSKPACDTGSRSVKTDPQFVSTSDWDLKSTSPAINKGATFSFITNDYPGRTRPQGTAYDIGAYEYGSSSYADTVAPSPPTLTGVN